MGSTLGGSLSGREVSLDDNVLFSDGGKGWKEREC